MNAKEAVKYVQENECKLVDIRFTDLFGMWHHFSLPADDFSEAIFEDGLGFDGSSIRGFQSIDESDMLLVPDPATLFIDPFAPEEYKTAIIICDIEDTITRERYSRDPRFVAKKAEAYLKTTGIADTALFGPEAEFFLFDSLTYTNHPHDSGFQLDSEEAHWNSGTSSQAYTVRQKGGYFPCSPNDRLQNVRTEMMYRMKEIGIHVEVHHHEVAVGQCEIDMRYNTLLIMADNLQKYKYVVKNVAHQWGMAATFMPKPLFGDNGSGMHVHQSLWKNDNTLMYDEKGYAGLSDISRWYIGGLLKHAAALLAFCAPTTNSYRRLVPGYEAPINLVYSSRNRSACIRIPMYNMSPKAKRIEFRAPDPTANGYLAMSAMLMAGLDGIQNRIEPPKPIDKDLYELPAEEKKDIKQTPGSLRQTLLALKEDHEFLLKGDVFTKDLIENYINYKLEHECDAMDLRPHPYEFYLYADA